MKIAVFLILITSSLRIYSKEIILKVNGDDCINCSKIIKFLQRENDLEDRFFNCVLRGEFQKDSIDIVKRFELNNFRHFAVLFSDSLYSSYTAFPGSELIVLSDLQNIIFRNSFVNFNATQFRLILESSENKSGEVIVPIDKRQFKGRFYVYGSDNFKLLITNDGREFLYDIYRKKLEEVKFDSNDLYICYKLIAGDEVKSELSLVAHLINKGERGLQPYPKYLNFKNDTTIECVFNFPLVEVSGNDTIISSKYLIADYSLSSKKFNNYKIFPSFKNQYDYYIQEKYFAFADKYYFFLKKKQIKEGEHYYYLSTVDKKFNDPEISKTWLMPDNYIKYRLYHNLNQPKFRKGILSNIASNQLYNFISNKSVKIPIEDSLFAGLKYVLKEPNKEHAVPHEKRLFPYILDAYYTADNYYRVLYSYNKVIHLLDFDDSGVLMDKELNTFPKLSVMDSFPLFVGDHYVLFNRQDEQWLTLKFIE